ncbi:MAG TPA: alanine racemase C-terminal domain-containing protein, partial [Armatimonadota bacterium]|nr:alanine racemase C-terminal domain-containing protein [Armatimonadota bacterium]
QRLAFLRSVCPGVEVGDEVVLLDGGYDFLSVEKVAEMLGTIPHDVITSIGKRVPRVYVGKSTEEVCASVSNRDAKEIADF